MFVRNKIRKEKRYQPLFFEYKIKNVLLSLQNVLQTLWFRVIDIFNITPLTLFGSGCFGVPGGGGGRKVPAAHNSKTIDGIEMKFGGVVENHKLINLV